MRNLCKVATKGTKKRILILLLLLVVLTFITYGINSFIIKPKIGQPKNVLEYIMVNFFNDFWAGVFIVSIANVIALRKSCYFSDIVFYVCVFIFESIMWEVIRPYILYLFNPLNKTPHFLWGDFVAYGLGNFLVYFFIRITTRKRRKSNI